MTPTFKQYGMFYNQTKFDASSHMDATNYMPYVWNSPDTFKDLGIVEYWAQTRRAESPLYKLSDFGGKNVIEHDTPYYKFTVPVAIDETVEVVKDITTSSTPGEDGAPFEIYVSRPAFGVGDILKPSQYSNIAMVVTNVPMRPRGEGAVYTVILVDNGVKYMDKKYLTPGQRIGKFGNVVGEEFSQNFSSWNRKGVSHREYLLYIGNQTVSTSYHITNKMNQHGVALNNYMDTIMEYYQIEGMMDPTTGNLGKSMENTFGLMEGKAKSAKMKEMAANGQIKAASFAYKMDDISMKEMWRTYETNLMWSPGGKIPATDGQEEVVLPTGLWQQLNSGYMYSYTLRDFSLKLFKQALYQYYLGKVSFSEPGSEPEIVIETGFAGMELANEAIRKEAAATGFLINATEVGAIQGKGMNLGVGYWFNQITLPQVARIKFRYNPAFDNYNLANEIDNPMIGSYRLSSYSFIMFDVNETADNVKLLKNSDSTVKMVIQNGTGSHPLTRLSAASGVMAHQSTGNFSGFKVFFTKRQDAIWVKDPTRVLKIVMINPVTGNPFGELK